VADSSEYYRRQRQQQQQEYSSYYGNGYDYSQHETIQGRSRGTWSSTNARSEVSLYTEGRPLEADVELWSGPNYTPSRMRIYSEDGGIRPFNAVVETPGGARSNTVSVRNIGPLEFPLQADAKPFVGDSPAHTRQSYSETIQGNSLKTFSFDAYVSSVLVTMKSQGLPVMAIVEVLQGPGHARQVAEIENQDGQNHPVSAIIETPGQGSTIMIRNMGPMEFPIEVNLEAHEYGEPY